MVCHLHVSVLFNVYVIYSYCCVNTCEMVLFYLWLSFANISCLLKFTENSKKREVLYKYDSLFHFLSWYELFGCSSSIYFYTSFWHAIWFYYCLPTFKDVKNCIKVRMWNLKWFRNKVMNFPTTDSLTSYSGPRIRILRYD